jgi:putative endonuclease
MREYYVYIMTNRSGTFYVGVTNDLIRRVLQHKAGRSNFTRRYRITRLVYFESTNHVWDALSREKQIKPWRREKKIRLIKTMNPRFLDLSEEWALSGSVASR